eukprot:g2040.t1
MFARSLMRNASPLVACAAIAAGGGASYATMCEPERQRESPLRTIQRRINESGVPLNLAENNFFLNLLAGGSIVMYWGAMWNLLDKYFFIKTVPSPLLNNALRVGVGLAILLFPDNDIKELGDKWVGIEEADGEDEAKTNDLVTSENVQRVVRESVSLLKKGLSLHDASDVVLTREDVRALYASADVDMSGALSIAEFDRFARDLSSRMRSNVDTAIAQTKESDSDDHEAEEEVVDRFANIEAWLSRHGMDLNLHHAYIQNIFIGTGIITCWSGLENLFNIAGKRVLMRNVMMNNVTRLCIAAFLLYLPNGNLNDIGDGFLEEEEDEEEEEDVGLTHLELHKHIHSALHSMPAFREHLEKSRKSGITLDEAMSAFDRVDANGSHSITMRELLLACARAAEDA